MNTFQFTEQNASTGAVNKTFIANVFSWMAVALACSGIIAYQFGNNANLFSLMLNVETGKLNILGWGVMFAPLIFTMVMGWAYERLSYAAMLGIFFAYSITMGMSLSFIFLVYTASSIYTVFGIAALMFGVMAVAGYTTKTDLTKMGTLLMMAVIGLVVAGLVNMFIQSDTLSYIMSFIGVIVFTGLTAYKVQMLKEHSQMVDANSTQGKKLAIWSALTLYITFINLFMSLLRLFGDRRS